MSARWASISATGQQLACITCALCIDACDEVMEKTGRPRGLIDYLALSDAPREQAGGSPKPLLGHLLRPRNFVYVALWGAIGLGLVIALVLRPAIEMTVRPVRNPTFVTLSGGAIRNTYDIRLRNKAGEMRRFALSVASPGFALSLEGAKDAAVEVPADAQIEVRLYLIAAPDSAAAAAERSGIALIVTDTTSTETARVGTVFNGKGK